MNQHGGRDCGVKDTVKGEIRFTDLNIPHKQRDIDTICI